MILVIGAMKEEITFLVNQLVDQQSNEIGGFTFYTGKLFNKEMVVVESGIGKVMSGILVATAVAHFKEITHVINIGVAGGTNNLNVGDVVIGSACLYGDADVTVFPNYQYGQLPRFPLLFHGDANMVKISLNLGAKPVDICTMDRFVHEEEFVTTLLRDHFPNQNIQCFDMESTAFAQSCHFFGLPFVSIRAISDVIGSDSQADAYNDNLSLACNASNQFLLQLLEIL